MQLTEAQGLPAWPMHHKDVAGRLQAGTVATLVTRWLTPYNAQACWRGASNRQQHSAHPDLSHLMFLVDDKLSGRISEATQLLVEGLP